MRPPGLPKVWRVQKKTTRHASRKNGSIPARIRITKAIGIPGMDQQADAFDVAIGISGGTRSVEIGQQGGHGAGQGRMLRFVAVDVLGQVFQAAGEVLRLIVGQAELRTRWRRCAGSRWPYSTARGAAPAARGMAGCAHPRDPAHAPWRAPERRGEVLWLSYWPPEKPFRLSARCRVRWPPSRGW